MICADMGLQKCTNVRQDDRAQRQVAFVMPSNIAQGVLSSPELASWVFGGCSDSVALSWCPLLKGQSKTLAGQKGGACQASVVICSSMVAWPAVHDIDSACDVLMLVLVAASVTLHLWEVLLIYWWVLCW